MSDETCKRCGAEGIGEYDQQTGEALPDPCLGKLPGVISACCGHGLHEGHIRFENGTRIRLAKSTSVLKQED
ncbi:hypothetical protein LCGC14_1305030 [marine sediment metagenome]|uniref:Uncharacterized protein n=1 Tax=marine sediment metagenome TaxID=412755 RepID=A0A0F9N578_9ZZZZ